MLSEVRIRAAKAAEKPYKLADSNRMYLYVSTTGAKSWRLDYSVGGKNLTLSLGQYPQIGFQRARTAKAGVDSVLLTGTEAVSSTGKFSEAVSGRQGLARSIRSEHLCRGVFGREVGERGLASSS